MNQNQTMDINKQDIFGQFDLNQELTTDVVADLLVRAVAYIDSRMELKFRQFQAGQAGQAPRQDVIVMNSPVKELLGQKAHMVDLIFFFFFFFLKLKITDLIFFKQLKEKISAFIRENVIEMKSVYVDVAVVQFVEEFNTIRDPADIAELTRKVFRNNFSCCLSDCSSFHLILQRFSKMQLICEARLKSFGWANG